MKKIQIYTKGYCPFCKRAKATLVGLELKFEEFDITDDSQLRQEMIERSQRKTVPQIFIGNHHVGGNDDLELAVKNDSLKSLL